jgi:hypothetical protein
MSSSAADSAAGIGLGPDYHKFQQSILSLAQVLAIMVSSNAKLNNFEVRKSSDGYEL